MPWQACYSQAAEERSAGRVPAETKECRRCHETKGKADFYHSKMTADGLQSYCKVGRFSITVSTFPWQLTLVKDRLVSIGQDQRLRWPGLVDILSECRCPMSVPIDA